MCWSTLTSLSTFGLRKAREKYWIGLGTGKPVSEYSYWGSRSSMLVALDKLVKGQVAHMLRLCCAAQLAGGAACLSTHSPGRGRRSATWAPPFNRSLRRQLLSRLTPRSSLRCRGWCCCGGSERTAAAPRRLRDLGPTSPAARPHCKVPLLWRAPASGLLPTREVG